VAESLADPPPPPKTEPTSIPKPEVVPLGPVSVSAEKINITKTDRPKATFNMGSIGKVTRTAEEKPAKKAEPAPDREIDFATLAKVWEEFAEQRKGQVAEYQLLKGDIRLDQNQVLLTLNNPIQEPLLLGIRTSLIGFLREKLGNNALSVSGVLEQTGQKKVIYTNKEKFEHLAEKYPVLKDLKERFGLDTDF
jgi:DNA polymerase-3 subunit gamma/tau